MKSSFTVAFGLEMSIPLLLIGVALTISFSLTRKIKMQHQQHDEQQPKGFWDIQIQDVLNYEPRGERERIIEEEIVESFSAFSRQSILLDEQVAEKKAAREGGEI